VFRAESSCMVLTLQAPFTYEALPPEKINFVPLKQKKSFNAKELMQVLMPNLCLSSIDLATISYSLALLSDMLAHHCLKQQVALDAVAQAQCQVAAWVIPLAPNASSM